MTTITGVGKILDTEGNILFDGVEISLSDEGTRAAYRSAHVFHGKFWNDSRDLFSHLRDTSDVVIELINGQKLPVRITGFTHGGSHAEVVGDTPLPVI